mgnify:CR=1 FL=1
MFGTKPYAHVEIGTKSVRLKERTGSRFGFSFKHIGELPNITFPPVFVSNLNVVSDKRRDFDASRQRTNQMDP